MVSLNQNGIEFTNIDLSYSSTRPSMINGKISNSSEDKIEAGRGLPVVDAVNIDWDGMRIDRNTIINTTGQLISWIKNNISSGGGLTQEQIELLETNNDLLTILSQYSLTKASADRNYASKTALDELTQIVNELQNGSGGGSGGSGESHILLTEEEYEALEHKDPNIVYFITDEENGGGEEEIEDPETTELYVNDVLQTTQNIVLAAGQTYTLRGNVVGTITIDASNGAPANNTVLRLNNVTLVNNENYGIKYLTPQNNQGYKDLVITLEKNSKNYIICKNEGSTGEDDPASIYSMNNLTIQGAGYLACNNSAGHGIRGTEVKLLAPHIYVNASHDAIHGKKIWICGGTYCVDNVNDIFGTSIGGTIRYAYGTIYINSEIHGKVFNPKSGLDEGIQKTGKFINIENPDIESNVVGYTLVDQSATSAALFNYYNNGNVKEYDTKIQATEMSGGTTVTPNNDGIYLISKQFVTISGKITSPINIPRTLQDVTIYLNDAYISTNCITVNGTSTNEPTISYDSDKSNVKIFALQDTYNAIINNCPETIPGQDSDAIKSEHNIKFEIKNDAYIYISSVAGDGIDGSDVEITDSKGVLMIHNCGERGIKGNAIIIGPSGNTSGTNITLVTDPTSSDYKIFEGAVIAKGNSKLYGIKEIELANNKIAVGSGYADIFARKGKALDKGTFITTASTLDGILVCGSIGATREINMDNSNNIYYNELVISTNLSQPVAQTNIPDPTIETYIAYPYKNSPI